MNPPDRIGRYRITGVIGEGVSGVVYKAFDAASQRVVAVKSLHRAPAADALVSRLREQAQAVSRLAHPAIVATHEIDQSDGQVFVAMEHVAGLNLAQWLDAAPLPAQAVLLQVMEQLLDALEGAHAAGVRHGDVKPGNILVTGAGMIKLTDVGLARAQGRSGVFAGVAPEYVNGRPIDHRVDIYAAGAVLYRMLVGREAFSDAGDPSHLGATLRPPSMVAEAQRPAVFDALVARALAHDPSQRFDSAAEFRDALRQVADPRLPELGARVITFGGPQAAAAQAVPELVIAIRDAVLAMPSHDPWARGGDPAAGDRPEPGPEPVSERPDPADAPAVFRGRADADDERRSFVAKAAAAATAALNQAAGSAGAVRVAEAARRAAWRHEEMRTAANPAPAPAPAAPELRVQPERSEPGFPNGGAPAGLTITGSVAAPRSRIDPGMPLAPPRLHGQLVLPSPATDDAGIPAEALRRVLKVLSAHFGPIAGDVLKHVAGRAGTVPELHRLLLEQAGGGVDKHRMAKQLRAAAKLPL
jgi:hypothetical protein